MSGGSWLAPCAVLVALAGGGGVIATAAAPATQNGAVLHMQVTGRGGLSEGTCFLVHTEQHERGVVYYFLTAAHLLDPDALGEQRAFSLRIQIVTDSGVIETSGADALFPAGTEQGLDLAVIRAASADGALMPVQLAGPPDPAQTFVVRGSAQNGRPSSTFAERVRFRSTRLIVGDRTVGDARDMAGAPAMVEGGVFGVVSDCGSNRVPVITLLSAASGFLSRAIPDWDSPN